MESSNLYRNSATRASFSGTTSRDFSTSHPP